MDISEILCIIHRGWQVVKISISVKQKLFKGGEISKYKKNYSRVEKAEERESKAQLLAKDLKTLQAENKSLVKKFTQSNKT